ncbi:MAG: triple tyrosine motif-containing protein [Fodinibius sp.]|nr:triple tyrosine motif-containing protein [Fodinibius sp.]
MEDGLVHNQINYITEDDSGNVWIGTRGGISVFKDGAYKQQKDIRNFTKSDGMTLMNTHFLWFDQEGYLWQGTNGGLQKLNVPRYWETDTMSVSHYALSKNGLGLEFNFDALVADSQQAWLGSMGGLVRLRPAYLKQAPLVGVDITQISVNTEPINWEDYNTKLNYKNGMLDFPSVTFPPSKNIFEFHFRGLSYTNPENVEYRYKLEGFDSDWMPVTADNSAVYTNLSPGDYTFVVKTKYSGSSFADTKATYDFSIAYPFWRTYWFYGLILLAMAGFIYGYIRIRVGYLEKNRLRELVDERTEYSANVALRRKRSADQRNSSPR